MYIHIRIHIGGLTVAKCKRSSPSSFFIFRSRLTTARQGPHHCWYTSTTKRREVVCVCVLKRKINEEGKNGAYGQSAVIPVNTEGQQHTGNKKNTLLQQYWTIAWWCDTKKVFTLSKTWQQPFKFLPVKPLVASISSHCSWFVTDAWIRNKINKCIQTNICS